MPTIAERAAGLPTQSGVYLFKDAKDRVIYVGKAINIKARVRQYLSGSDDRAMIPFLVAAAKDVDVVVTHTEKEALLLENTLIKKHKPRFNARLRDDSSFLHLRIDPRHPWPRYDLVRRVRNDRARTFGPYHAAARARNMLAYIQRVFPLRTCTDTVLKSRKRPCLLYQMGRCVAPCAGKTTPEAYAELVARSIDLLEGRHDAVIQHLRTQMDAASESLAYERAARYRDLLQDVQTSLERQKVIDTQLADRDVWGIHRDGDRGCVSVLPVRGGFMHEPRIFDVRFTEPEPALLSTLLNVMYGEGASIPAEVLVPVQPTHITALCEVLSDRRGRRVRVHVPQRGVKHKLMALAIANAKVRYDRENSADNQAAHALRQLATVLRLPAPPRRIECFDNSHLRGENAVSAMAVFIDGKPSRKDYRRYRIKEAQGDDDYGAMREVLTRRFRRALQDDAFPDLLVIDGGKGQLGVAVAVLQDLGLHGQRVCAIAKPKTERRRGQRHATDKIFVPETKDAIRLEAHHPGLRMLQHIRDQVHETVVRYHRKVRSKDTLTSLLEGIPGVGPTRRRALLRELGSAQGVAEATLEELREVSGVGPRLAETLYRHLRGDTVPADETVLLDVPKL